MRKFGFLLLSLLAACSSLRPAETATPPPTATAVAPIPTQAIVHFYRRGVPVGPIYMTLYDGGNRIGDLIRGTYLDYDTAPGPRVFKATGAGAGSIPYATSLKAGQSYYLLVYFLGSPQQGNAAITPMDPATATAQMAPLKPAQP